jgi:hypothetical protein
MPPDQPLEPLGRKIEDFGKESLEITAESRQTRILAIAQVQNSLPEVDAKKLNVLRPASNVIDRVLLTCGGMLLHGDAPDVVAVENREMPWCRQNHCSGQRGPPACHAQVWPSGTSGMREVPALEPVDLPRVGEGVKGRHELNGLIR